MRPASGRRRTRGASADISARFSVSSRCSSGRSGLAAVRPRAWAASSWRARTASTSSSATAAARSPSPAIAISAVTSGGGSDDVGVGRARIGRGAARSELGPAGSPSRTTTRKDSAVIVTWPMSTCTRVWPSASTETAKSVPRTPIIALGVRIWQSLGEEPVTKRSRSVGDADDNPADRSAPADELVDADGGIGPGGQGAAVDEHHLRRALLPFRSVPAVDGLRCRQPPTESPRPIDGADDHRRLADRRRLRGRSPRHHQQNGGCQQRAGSSGRHGTHLCGLSRLFRAEGCTFLSWPQVDRLDLAERSRSTAASSAAICARLTITLTLCRRANTSPRRGRHRGWHRGPG